MAMQLRKTDRLFRQYILLRDGYTCQRCGSTYDAVGDSLRGLHVSHYWGRGRENTRFDPDNCILLCWGCHRLWGHGDGRNDYMKFMVKKLGQHRFDELEARAYMAKKRDDELDVLGIKQLLAELSKGGE